MYKIYNILNFVVYSAYIYIFIILTSLQESWSFGSGLGIASQSLFLGLVLYASFDFSLSDLMIV